MEAAMAELLHIENLSAGYGEAVILHGIGLSLAQGETLALLGRNGTGKTTLMNTIAGATRQHAGSVMKVCQPSSSSNTLKPFWPSATKPWCWTKDVSSTVV